MHSLHSQERIRKLITDQLNLPSPPAIAVRILNTVQREDASMKDLAGIISADPALTAKLLRVANSNFYSLPNRVTSIERALAVLGINVIKNIALSFAIAGDLRGQAIGGFDFNYFWRRSVTSAVAAELLTALFKQKDEDIFVTALLHDIGVLVIYLGKGQEYSLLFKERMTTGIPLIELERQKFGFDHQLVGATLIADWGLPESIAEPMRYHHELDAAPEKFRKTAEILSIAGRLSAIYNETDSAERVRLLQKELTDKHDIEAELVRGLVDDVANQSIGILKTFEIDPGDIRPFSQMLQEANEQLGQLNLTYEQLVLELKEAKERAERLATELREANSRLKELVFRDGLTGLFNHRYFQESLEKEMSRSARYHSFLSLVIFDIDFFKKVNDTYGHPVGDLVLINIARTAESAVRTTDVVSRYGGEEFAVILPETDQSGMKVFAERLRRSIEKIVTEIESQKTPIKVTISVGGATLVPEMSNISKEILVETADKALYSSKKNGRNRVTILEPSVSS
jgi:diguanylate cyclase (GGDEF)-like protein